MKKLLILPKGIGILLGGFRNIKIRYLSIEDILVIHYIVIDAYFSEYKDDENEQKGVKDSGLLSSALFEPNQTFEKKELYPDVLSKAAAYLRSIAINHPFYNGNKRTAIMAMIIFLEENGYQVIVNETKLYKLALAVVNSKPTFTTDQIVSKYLSKYTKFVGGRNSQGYTRILKTIKEMFKI